MKHLEVSQHRNNTNVLEGFLDSGQAFFCLKCLIFFVVQFGKVTCYRAFCEKIHHYFDCQLNSANTLLPLLLLVRYDRFMDAFEHVSQRIDDIYKVTEDYS